MKVSRAGFLKICGALLLGRTVDASPLCSAIGGAFIAAAPASVATFRMESASAAFFRPHLHTTFAVQTPGGTRLPLVLARVTERPVALGVEQFSLAFHAPRAAPPLHGTNTFRHSTLGEFELFIGPVGAASPQRIVYEACFSRLLSADVCQTGDYCHA